MNNQNTIKPGMTLDMKAKLFAQYWGQNVYNNRNYPDDKPNQLLDHVLLHFTNDHEFLELKPLSSITDEDAIEVAKLVHQRPNANFKVTRKWESPFSIHVEWTDNINCCHHLSINSRGNINANKNFGEYQGDKAKSFKHNIGENDLTASLPVPYIAIVDYLRSKGYALPWMGYSVEDMVQAGWIKLKGGKQ